MVPPSKVSIIDFPSVSILSLLRINIIVNAAGYSRPFQQCEKSKSTGVSEKHWSFKSFIY
jgi:hypothetical protein